MIEILMAALAVIAMSALCSGTEAALFSVPLIKVKQKAESKSKSAMALLTIRENMRRPVATIVVFTNMANIVGSTMVGSLIAKKFGDEVLGLASAFLTILIIIFAEIIPKTLGEMYAMNISLVTARPILFLSRVMTPILWVLEKATAPFTKNEARLSTNEAEIRLLAALGQQQGIIEHNEGEMIHRVFELNDLTAGDLLTPRVVLTYLRGGYTLNQAREDLLQSRHSRMIVVGEDIDDIRGFVLRAELLKALVEGRGDLLVSSFAYQVRLVPRQIKADVLLVDFRRSRQHLAVVLDEFGGVAGVVTLEDVLEVITGEIMDETDEVEDLQKAAIQRTGRQAVLALEDSDLESLAEPASEKVVDHF